jgi:hypothetical protein
MRRLLATLLFALAPLLAQTADERDAVAAVQKVFDAIATHDAVALKATMLPDARIYAVRDQTAPVSRSADEMGAQLAGAQESFLERFTAAPKVFIRGRLAQVWGEYEFQRGGKFSHCGVDSISLFKTAEGWKIAAIVYTAETTGCSGQK